MAGDYPALGFNPAPGSVATITDMADSLSTIATQLGEAHTDLTQVGKAGGIWTGDASEAFAKTVEELPELLEKGNESMSGAATALNGWATDLKTMQRDADEYETQAAAALKAFNSALANPNLNLAGQTFQEGAQLQQAQAALDRAEASLRTAGEKLEEIRAAARRLFTQHIELGAKVAAALQKAKEEAPEETNIFEEAASAIGDALESISDILAKIGEVLSAISSALGMLAVILAPFPPVGAIFAAAAGVTAAAALGTKGLAKAGGADVSWASMAGDALGALPVLGGLTRGVRVTRTAAASGGVGKAREAATRFAKQRADDIGADVINTSSWYAKKQVAKMIHPKSGNRWLQGNGRLATENAYQNFQRGQWVGTRGFNKALDLLGRPAAVDPMSTVGRGIDASIKGGITAYKTSEL